MTLWHDFVLKHTQNYEVNIAFIKKTPRTERTLFEMFNQIDEKTWINKFSHVSIKDQVIVCTYVGNLIEMWGRNIIYIDVERLLEKLPTDFKQCIYKGYRSIMFYFYDTVSGKLSQINVYRHKITVRKLTENHIHALATIVHTAFNSLKFA